jgi:DNA modification methylase
VRTYRVIEGDALKVAQGLPSESVQTVVTSPPYFGLRSYGTQQRAWGGRQECTHVWGENLPARHPGQVPQSITRENTVAAAQNAPTGSFCQECGAWRGDFGLEPTPELYIEHLVDIFRAVRRILRDDGTLWLNLGDTYWGGKGQSGSGGKEYQQRRSENGLSFSTPEAHVGGKGKTKPQDGRHEIIKPKDLIGIPWMAAFALRADGWYLRSDIVWHKPNPMPESIEDRPTRAHEFIFLLTKAPRYFYDHKAIQEVAVTSAEDKASQSFGAPGGKVASNTFAKSQSGKKWEPQMGGGGNGFKGHSGNSKADGTTYVMRNKRDVWSVTTRPFPEAHFATFNPELITPCVLAGAREGDTVYDPFTGSGTTGLVALRHGRNFIGSELNPEYAAMARRRIAGDAPLLNTEAAA